MSTPEERGTKPLLSIILNCFNPTANRLLSSMLDFVLESLDVHTQAHFELIISDGSGHKDPKLAEKCAERGWKYLYTTQRVPFAHSYNRGMEAAKGDYRVWMASDIIVAQGWETKLINELRRTNAWMIAPYLSSCDYPGQVRNWVARMHTFAPSAMTFNLNMITRECYEKVGLMDERFSGTFNDIDYLIRIRLAGGQASIADAGDILHISRATVSVTSLVDGNQDRARFLQKYPELVSSVDSWQYNYVAPVLCRSTTYRYLIRAAYAVPGAKHRERMARFVMRFEPLFHKHS